jgi:hypothetical protein
MDDHTLQSRGAQKDFLDSKWRDVIYERDGTWRIKTKDELNKFIGNETT